MSNPERTKMHSKTQERRRKFYGWGREGDEVSPQEIAEFASASKRGSSSEARFGDQEFPSPIRDFQSRLI
jgi:hypothetical protein